MDVIVPRCASVKLRLMIYACFRSSQARKSLHVFM